MPTQIMPRTESATVTYALDLDLQLRVALDNVRARRSILAELARDRLDILTVVGQRILPIKSDVEKGLDYEWEEAKDLYEAAHTDVEIILGRIAANGAA